MPQSRVFSQAIAESPSLTELKAKFDKVTYCQISDRCNDNLHINFFRNLRTNAIPIDYSSHIKSVEQFRQDFTNLFIKHIAYLFYLRPEYMGSSDYVDCLECDLRPPEDSQYWVSRLVQDIFDKIVTPHRPDLTDFLRENTVMQLR